MSGLPEFAPASKRNTTPAPTSSLPARRQQNSEAVVVHVWPVIPGRKPEILESQGREKKKKNPMSREITQGSRTANCHCHFSFSLWLLTLPSTTTTTSPHAHAFLQVHCTPGTYQFFTAIISAPRGEGYINLTPLSAADTPARRRREPDPVSFLSNHFAQAYSAVRIHPG